MDTKIFGLAERALQLCEERAVTISDNIVNSSTPNYKAKDIDFYGILQNATENTGLTTTNPHHIQINGSSQDPKQMYRVPTQISLDGNTVDADLERKSYIRNAINYEVSLTFIKNKFDEFSKAVKGE